MAYFGRLHQLPLPVKAGEEREAAERNDQGSQTTHNAAVSRRPDAGRSH